MTGRPPTGERVHVSVLIPVLNEAGHLPRTVPAMRSQELIGSIELIFVDGGSTDGTRPFLEALAREDPRIRVLDNPARRTPNGLNVGLRASRGEYVARMDAHTVYCPRYLANGVERLERGDVTWVSGPQLAKGTNRWSSLNATALGSRLGFGGSPFRTSADREIEVLSGFTGMWRRDALEALGGWDEGWPVNQDAEIGARIRAGGGRVVCIPGMGARYLARESPRGLARQYWRYGHYRAKTARRHPDSMRPSHLLAPGLAAALALAAGAPRRIRAAARGGLLAYGLTLVVASLRLGARSERFLLPPVFATMHLSWGFGFLAGVVRFGPPLAAIRRVLASVIFGGGRQRPR